VGPRAGLNRCGKSHPPREFDPRTVKPVASRYTDYDTRPTNVVYKVVIFAGYSIFFRRLHCKISVRIIQSYENVFQKKKKIIWQEAGIQNSVGI
jgi:hypothetical protein